MNSEIFCIMLRVGVLVLICTLYCIERRKRKQLEHELEFSNELLMKIKEMLEVRITKLEKMRDEEGKDKEVRIMDSVGATDLEERLDDFFNPYNLECRACSSRNFSIDHNFVLTSNPPQYRVTCAKCGNIEYVAPNLRGYR